MATKVVAVVMAVVVMAVFVQRTTGLSLCHMTEEDLNMCKPSVTKPDPVPPTPDCCKALKGADLKCLCSYKNSMMLPALGIDPDLALALPSQCQLTPPADC